MIKLKFGVVHKDCLVNELSREFSRLKIVCPGGFQTGKKSVEEIIALATKDKRKVKTVIDYLKSRQCVSKVALLKRTGRFTFLLFTTKSIPTTGFVSTAVTKNRCFRLAPEVQEGGIEKWVVGCVSRDCVKQLKTDLAQLGELKYAKVSNVSYSELIKPKP